MFVPGPKAHAETPAITAPYFAPPGMPNRHYPSHRAPLRESPLVKLPPRSIRAQGWLRKQLELMADGMTGRLTLLSRWCRKDGNAWASRTGEGDRGWEELPYWLKGFLALGYSLDDARILEEAKGWIDAVLASQEEDGWFGPRENKRTPDIWPNMVFQNSLQTLHEATGDPRVLPFLLKYSRWLLDLPEEKLLPGSWQKIRGGDNLATVYWLYDRTGEAWLLDLAKKLHRRTVRWDEGIPSWHGVNICQSFREPAVFYEQTGDPKDLAAAERNYDTVMQLYGQVPGGMFGADENARPGFSDPRQGAETCSMVELMASFELLLAITGNPLYADRCEDVAFNSLPASMTADLKALRYLTAPNMVQADAADKAPMIENSGCMFAYSPGERYRCCQHNVSHGWPYFAEHLWMATRGDGLAAVLYAPCTVEALVADGVKARIEETTDYPFDEAIAFRIALPRPAAFPLAFRIPGWCSSPRLAWNGNPVTVQLGASRFAVVHRTWQDGDRVELSLPMRLKLRRWPSNHDAASIDHGPLTYSLRIQERERRFGGTDAWPEVELYPASAWNYGLVIDSQAPEANFRVVRSSGPLAAQPFAAGASPIRVTARARRVPRWKLEGTMVGKLQASPVRTSEPEEEVELVPMGSARLRITAFPVASDGPGAHDWTDPPPPPKASHSHDNLFALNDGVMPRSSSDDTVPRFTWWDHRGTTEWVQYDFEKPRSLSRTEVYWFDDTGSGLCRVPKSWRLLWRRDGAWVPVGGEPRYGVERDRSNAAAFSPIETDGVRLEVELRDGFSGGILEWKVE